MSGERESNPISRVFDWITDTFDKVKRLAVLHDTAAEVREDLERAAASLQVAAAQETAGALARLRAGIAGEAKNERAPSAPAPDAEPKGRTKRLKSGQIAPDPAPAPVPHSARKPGPSRKKPGRAR